MCQNLILVIVKKCEPIEMCTNWNDLCHRWRIWIRPTIILLYALFVVIVLPLLIVNTVKDGFTKKDQLILIGGLFVFTTLPICIWHIMQHIVHFTKPILQKPIIRILWMVPIYAMNAVCINYFSWKIIHYLCSSSVGFEDSRVFKNCMGLS